MIATLPTEAESIARTARLHSLYNRATRYEITLSDGARTFLVGYTSRKSRQGLLGTLQAHGEAIVALACPIGNEQITFGRNINAGATIGPWQAKFTGRTERDAIMTGELQRVGVSNG